MVCWKYKQESMRQREIESARRQVADDGPSGSQEPSIQPMEKDKSKKDAKTDRVARIPNRVEQDRAFLNATSFALALCSIVKNDDNIENPKDAKNPQNPNVASVAGPSGSSSSGAGCSDWSGSRSSGSRSSGSRSSASGSSGTCTSGARNPKGKPNKRSSKKSSKRNEKKKKSTKKPRTIKPRTVKPRTVKQEPIKVFPATVGTEHPIKGILYEVPATERKSSRWLINWDNPNWTEGPTVIKESSLNNNIIYRKHKDLREKYQQWMKRTTEFSSYKEEIQAIKKMAKELKDQNENDLKLYRLFKKRFLARSGKDGLEKEWSDWKLWNLYAYKRYLAVRKHRALLRPNGDSKNYGWEDLFAICEHVGSKKNVRKFAKHLNEIV